MIQDIEGGTTEPSRHKYAAVLSTTIAAAVSIGLFIALIVPPSRDAAGPWPQTSTTAAVTLTIRSNPLNQTRLDLTLDSLCPDGTRLSPPYHLAFDGGSGQVYAVRYVVGGYPHAVPVTIVPDKRTPHMTVACGTSDVMPSTHR